MEAAELRTASTETCGPQPTSRQKLYGRARSGIRSSEVAELRTASTETCGPQPTSR